MSSDVLFKIIMLAVIAVIISAMSVMLYVLVRGTSDDEA